MYTSFYNTLKQHIPLTKDDMPVFEAAFEKTTLLQNAIAEEENKVPRYLYYINDGYMRLFYYDDNGDEVTTLLAGPGQFITAFIDFIHEKKSAQNLECITACDVLKIEKSRLAALIEGNTGFKHFSVIIFEQAIVSTQVRANDLATLSAEQRYKKLLENSPELIKHIPLQYIASYLGIKPQSLSRIRKQIIK